MGNNEMIKKVELLVEYEAAIEEMKAEAEELKNDIKRELEERNLEEMEIGQYVVRHRSVLTTRFDTKRFKQAFGEDVYNAFTKQVASRRFSIA